MPSCPFIERVPKNVAENLRWRRGLRVKAMHDKGLQQALFDACMEDVLFWFNFAMWVFEPRAAVKIKPFVTWEHQDPAIVTIDEAITRSEETQESVDVTVDKSRAQGGTYIYLDVGLRRWLRDPMFSMGLVTRNEDLVDSRTDSDTLIWKLAWQIERLPAWMLPEGFSLKEHRSLSDHSILNPANGATIVGYAAGQDVGRGGRKSVFACDEIGAKDFIKGGKDEAVMESLHDVTNCIILCSTHGGDTGVFYDAANDTDGNGVKVVLDWKDNPLQSKNAYVVREGVPVAARPEEQVAVKRYHKGHPDILRRLERKGHQVEGKFRSPWYDMRCLRPKATPRLIARELDRNPRGAVGKVFDTTVLDRMKEQCCRPPVWRGRVVYDNETLEVKGLVRQESGPLELWFDPGMDHSPPPGRYGVGCDISAGGSGEYSSNSVGCGIDRMTGEQVLQYTVMGMMGTKFARLMVALSKWLDNAYLGWEDSGVAKPFAREVLEVIGYGNVYYREADTVGDRKRTRKPGWWPGSDDAKGTLFEDMCLAMDEDRFFPRSADFIAECGEYEWEDGKIVHRPTKRAGVHGKAHGDRCVAGGVAWLLCEDRPAVLQDGEERPPRKIPIGSIAWFEQQEGAERRRFTDDEPQMELRDLLRLP